MKKILGLDLGTNSIGWALVETNDENIPQRILSMGSRIIPLNSDERDEFLKGNAISKNQNRTQARTQRKGYDRRQIRKKELKKLLADLKIEPTEELMNLPADALWQLRSDATNPDKNISPNQLGRILYHINQKRGYKSARTGANLDKKETEYVSEVKSRHSKLKENGQTIGNFISKEITNAKTQNSYFRKKEVVFPREAYAEEFDTIMAVQKQKHSFLTDELINQIKTEVIFYQRALKSQKQLISICEFEGFEKIITRNQKEKKVFIGPRVSPKSSPLNQLCKIWEVTNNINLKVKNPEGSKYKWGDFSPSFEQKQAIAAHLFQNASLTYTELLKILNLQKENVYGNKQLTKGIQGNILISELKKYLGNEHPLLEFNVNIIPYEKQAYIVDKSTGEIIEEVDAFIIDKLVEEQPLFKLWHTIYSIKDSKECENALIKNFSIKYETAASLAKIDFTKFGYANKSHKAIRKILPYLMHGYNYSDACSLAGYNHSNSLTLQENEERELKDKLDLIPKNGLRQPVVEKILNQMINLVNAIFDKFGKPDSIRVELARELKQSKDERNESDKQNLANKKLNDEISKRLIELGLPATKKYIQKYKFIFPVRENKLSEAQVNCQCIYCGENFNLSEALSGDSFDVDHIVPKALLFDDSQLNKVLVHRKCNSDKTNTTAYDYIASKGEQALSDYLDRVDDWYKKNIISYGKMLRLKVSYKEYSERKKNKKETEADKKLWENFINRNLRETAYISRKASELLKHVCRNVSTTDGSVTSKLRELWGWDDVLMNLQLPKYRELGKTEWKEWTSDNGKNKHKKEVVINWTKRDDHRHHAIDALVVACTQQGFIQRINTLNASDVRNEMLKEIETAKQVYDERKTLLDNYLLSKKPFTTAEVEKEADRILVSFKAGKKVATLSRLKAAGVNKIKGVLTPRGPLHEQFVYGKINVIVKDKPAKFLFENSDKIVSPKIKGLVKDRLASHNNNPKDAIASLKKEPIFLDKNKTKILEKAHCYNEEVVLKYKLQDINKKDLEFIVDKSVREKIEQRLEEYKGNVKEAFKNTLWFNESKQIPIRTVRLRTNLSSIEPVKKDEKGKDIGFSKPGNNHHIAIYKDHKGNLTEHVCTLWHAVERKKYKLPVVLNKTGDLWSSILNKDLPQTFLDKLPQDNLELEHSLQQNEMFILGMTSDEFKNAYEKKDYSLISRNLYLVWSVSPNNYWFRHHLETKNSDLKKLEGARETKRFYLFKSIGTFLSLNPIKLKVNNLGEIKFLEK